MKEKTKKPFYKRWWFIVIAAPLIGAVILGTILDAVGYESSETESQPKAEETVKKEEKPKEEKKEAKQKPKKLTFEEQIVKDHSIIESAKIEDNKLYLTANGNNMWSENTIVTTYTYMTFEAVKQGFENDVIKEVYASINATLTDNKGNESYSPVETFTYTRETFEQLNYENFLNLASGQEWRILNEADKYFIHAWLYDNIKDKYKQGLTHGRSKQ